MSNKFALPAIIAAVVLLTGTLGYMSPNFVEATEGSVCEDKCMEKWSKKMAKCEKKADKCEDKKIKCENKTFENFDICEAAGGLTCEDDLDAAMDKCEDKFNKCEDKANEKLAECPMKF